MARLYRPIDPLAQQRFAELSEQSLTFNALLAGTPGSLQRRVGTGYAYWYRVYYPVPGKQAEILIGREGDTAAFNAMQERMAAAEATARQVASLRPFGYQIADKVTARVLVELHNAGYFAQGRMVSGPLAIAAWLNAWGLRPANAPAKRRPDEAVLDLIDPTPEAIASFAFVSVSDTTTGKLRYHVNLPGLSGASMSLRQPAPSSHLNANAQRAVLLAGNHAVPALIPAPGPLVWERLAALGDHALPAVRPTLALAAALTERDPWALLTAWEQFPAALQGQLKPLRQGLIALAQGHPELADLLNDCLR